MNINIVPKPVNFKFGEYINRGFELIKKDFGSVFIGGLLAGLMSMIPFCGYLAMGNFYKYLRKVNKNQNPSAGEIFDFKDFMPYFILSIIVYAGVFLINLPMFIIGGIAGSNANDFNIVFSSLAFLYTFAMVFVICYFVLKGFYIPLLISFKGITEIKKAWDISKVMTKGNVINILLFGIVVGCIGSLGVVACGIGILFTLPLSYTIYYFAYEDAIQQVEVDEVDEIGIKEKY